MDKIEVTQADRDAAASLWVNVDGDVPTPAILAEAERYRQGVYDHTPAVRAFARHRLATRTDATPVAEAWEVFEAAMKDPEYAWGWHCNLAVPIMDATGITHKQANMAAAHLMQHLWKCDITTHPNYQYEKSGAQAYAEFRIEADKAEDAALPDAAHPPATDVAALVEAATGDDVDAWFQVGALKEQLRQANETIKAINGHLPAYAAAMKENKELKSAEADLVKVIRAQPYPESDDYIEVRRDERERIISALAPFTKGHDDE